MPFWFNRINADGFTELAGPYDQIDEAVDAFQSESQADKSIGVFSAFNEEFAESMTMKYQESGSSRPYESESDNQMSQNELPVRLRDAYKQGLRGGRNPYPLNSQEFNDFERARDKATTRFKVQSIADPRLYADYQANKQHVVGSEAWKFEDEEVRNQDTAQKVREVLKYKEG